MRCCSVSCNFSSTVPRISSSFLLLSARIVFRPCTSAPRTLSIRVALESSRFFSRVSIIVSWASKASFAAFWRAAPARSMDSSRAVLAAAFWRWFSARTAEKSRSVAVVVRALSPCMARSCSASRSVSLCKTGVTARTKSSAVSIFCCGSSFLCITFASTTASRMSPATASTSSTYKIQLIGTSPD